MQFPAESTLDPPPTTPTTFAPVQAAAANESELLKEKSKKRKRTGRKQAVLEGNATSTAISAEDTSPAAMCPVVPGGSVSQWDSEPE